MEENRDFLVITKRLQILVFSLRKKVRSSNVILNIHGFKSAGHGNKYDMLKESFGENNVVSPTLPLSPKEAIDYLNRLIKEPTILIGTSLGGFYASVLSVINPNVSQALIINPVVEPSVKMRRHLGESTNFKTGESFIWTEEHLVELDILSESIRNNSDWDKCHFVVGSQDELTNPQNIQSWYDCDIRIYDDGHRFNNCFAEALQLITNI